MGDTINMAEERILTNNPVLVRIPSHTSPRVFERKIWARHNPDYKLLEPETGRGLWVESKGLVRNPHWFDIIKTFTPLELFQYRVMLISTNKKDRTKTKEKLTRLGVTWCEGFKLPESWVADATALYLGKVELLPEHIRQEYLEVTTNAK